MDWVLQEQDERIRDRELRDFVPDKVFDAHLHLYAADHFDGAGPALTRSGPEIADWSEYQSRTRQILPAREISGLAFGFPATNVRFNVANQFVSQEVQRGGGIRIE